MGLASCSYISKQRVFVSKLIRCKPRYFVFKHQTLLFSFEILFSFDFGVIYKFCKLLSIFYFEVVFRVFLQVVFLGIESFHYWFWCSDYFLSYVLDDQPRWLLEHKYCFPFIVWKPQKIWCDHNNGVLKYLVVESPELGDDIFWDFKWGIADTVRQIKLCLMKL